MRVNDALLGGVLLVFAAILAIWAQTFPAIPGQDYGAAAFPTVIAAGFAACAVVLIARGVRTGGPMIVLSDWVRARHGLRNVAITIAAVVFYILAAGHLGFTPTMAVVLLVLLRMLGVGWVASVAVAVPAAFVIQRLFVGMLYVPLPRGPLAMMGL